MSDFQVGDEVELLHEGKPTGIRGTVCALYDGGDYGDTADVYFSFSIDRDGTEIGVHNLRRVEPEFTVQPGDWLERNDRMDEAHSTFNARDAATPIQRVWRKVDDTTLEVVWERER
jgi:hypothetical protein